MLRHASLGEWLLQQPDRVFASAANARTVSGLSASARALLVAERHLHDPARHLVVCRDSRTAEAMCADLEACLSKQDVLFFPGLGMRPYEWREPFDSVLEARLAAACAIAEQKRPLVVVATLESFLYRLPRLERISGRFLGFSVGSSVDREDVRNALRALGFQETPAVADVGEFAVRGGIIDINPFLADHPIRIEIVDDRIASLRAFDLFSQRSIAPLKQVRIAPMGEFHVEEHALEAGLAKIQAKDPAGADFLRQAFAQDVHPGIQWLMPWFEPSQSTLSEWLGSHELILDAFGDMAGAVSQVHVGFQEAWKDSLARGIPGCAPEELLLGPQEASELCSRASGLRFTGVDFATADHLHLECREQTRGGGGFAEIEAASGEGRVVLVADSEGAAARLARQVSGYDVEAIVVGEISSGFVLPQTALFLLTDHQLFQRLGRRKASRATGGSASIAGTEALERGELVIHRDHGVGRFLGLTRMLAGGAEVDCILLEYGGGDRLTFPVWDLHKIERYPVGDGESPDLHRLGGRTWKGVRERVRKHVVRIARELVELYAKRQTLPGFAFPPDGEAQREFESVFEYDPTPDQIRAVAEIKEDMERALPMDRLVCGDVGFGKTEVAMRAAFKAVSARKQVAILVPTTLLAAQHYESFCSRFSGWPVEIELVNRYRTAGEKRSVFKHLSEGKVDIVVSTHSLLSDKVEFANLGLLVVDEEQRFGVKQKERLREMRLEVDTLSMSATPIPRTLHLSLSGVRDISLISTPPRNRLPVDTQVLPSNHPDVAEAVRAEIARGGQVFAVRDLVQGIEDWAARLEEMAPGARVAIAHGQMDERDLERVMSAFVHGEFDILACTSIVESGLDIPNANTMLVENAHRFGVSQLYQLRGRVGRSGIQARALLLVPPNRELNRDAQHRLHALERFTDLGSGYQLAMRDLEIRGAGNLLGTEQHGFIAEVGYETYLRLVREAVAELKGGPEDGEDLQPRIEFPCDAYLSESWIEDGLQRIALYQRLARARTPEEVRTLGEEMCDRFGGIPEASAMLLQVSVASVCARSLRVAGLQVKGNLMAMTFVENGAPAPQDLAAMAAASPRPLRFLNSTPLQAVVELGKGDLVALCNEAVRCLEGMRKAVC